MGFATALYHDDNDNYVMLNNNINGGETYDEHLTDVYNISTESYTCPNDTLVRDNGN